MNIAPGGTGGQRPSADQVGSTPTPPAPSSAVLVRRGDLDNLAFAIQRFYEDRHDPMNVSSLAGYAAWLVEHAESEPA
jgi:hypothetical protein